MADYIKIPKDFKSLHDLKELIGNYEVVSRLSNALNNYQSMYIESFFMDIDEVLKYIPPKQHSEFKIKIRGHEFSKKINLSLAEILLEESPEKEKVFLIDNINKKIVLCDWKKKNNTNGNLKYTGEINFLLGENKNLKVLVHYAKRMQQAVGGVWINGQSTGYLSGHHYTPYTLYGFDIYEFCTKTNKFIGYNGSSEEPERGWIK